MKSKPFNVILKPEPFVVPDEELLDMKWVALGVELDAVAQGKTIHEALHRLEQQLVVQGAIEAEHGQEPYANLGEAPSEVWELWETGLPVEVGGFERAVSYESFDPRWSVGGVRVVSEV